MLARVRGIFCPQRRAHTFTRMALQHPFNVLCMFGCVCVYLLCVWCVCMCMCVHVSVCLRICMHVQGQRQKKYTSALASGQVLTRKKVVLKGDKTTCDFFGGTLVEIAAERTLACASMRPYKETYDRINIPPNAQKFTVLLFLSSILTSKVVCCRLFWRCV